MVSMLFSQYMFNNCITWVLAILGISLWILDHEFFLVQRETTKALRMKLLWTNLVLSILQAISITFDNLLWIRFVNILRPVNRVGITEEWADYQQKNLKMTLFDKAIFPHFWVEILVNMISPMPWFYETTYIIRVDGYDIDFYFNTVLLILMTVIRTYHIIKIMLQSSVFMSDGAERITRVFSSGGKFYPK